MRWLGHRMEGEEEKGLILVGEGKVGWKAGLPGSGMDWDGRTWR